MEGLILTTEQINDLQDEKGEFKICYVSDIKLEDEFYIKEHFNIIGQTVFFKANKEDYIRHTLQFKKWNHADTMTKNQSRYVIKITDISANDLSTVFRYNIISKK